MPHLVIVKGPGKGKQHSLARPRTILGRDEKACDVLLLSHDQGRRRNTISRKHAIITREDDKYYIEDGDRLDRPSHNGTSVNQVEVAFPERVLLKNNDIITICEFALAFYDGIPTPLAEADDDSSSFHSSVSHERSSAYISQASEKLKLLLDITNRLSHTLDLETLLPEVVETLLQLFQQADRCFLILVDDTTGELDPRVFKARDSEPQGGFSASIVKQCIETMRGHLSEDPRRDFPDSSSVAGLSLRWAMCAPLWTANGKAFGVLLLDSRSTGKSFSADDLQLLMGVAGQASIALSNARYHRDALARERYLRDLILAREVVKSFLPERLPDIPGYAFFASYESAMEVGGDYYDLIPLEQQRLGVLVGDVSGKGVAAALVMARFSAEVRACLRTETDLASAVCRLNAIMQPLSLTDRFMTLAALVLAPTTHTVTMVNAGHPSPLLFSQATGIVRELVAEDGLPLGVADGYAYASNQFTLAPGDTLILFSDGVTEAMNTRRKQLKVDGIRAALRGSAAAPREVGERILRAVEEHTAGCSQHDDITLVCVGRTV